MKWFFCLNDAPMQFELAQVAVHTAKLYTSLEPICLYDGSNETHLKWFKSQGVTVIRHRSYLHEDIIRVWGDHVKALGAFARIDIPLFTEDEFVLYTDTDIMFQSDVSELENIKPRYLAIAYDTDPTDKKRINSGVMLLNAKTMRETLPEFCLFLRNHMSRHWICYDQDGYLQYYHLQGMTDELPLEYNWKTNWSPDLAFWTDERTGKRSEKPREEPLKIVHFIGYKPYETVKYYPGTSPYYNEHAEKYRVKWRDLNNCLQIMTQKIAAKTVKKNNLYPHHVFSIMTPEDIADTKKLEDIIADFGLNIIDDVQNDFSPEHKHKWHGMRIWQQPCQFAPFLQFLYDIRSEINSYLEIGCAYGGTFYVIDSFLRALNPTFTGSTALDIYRAIMGWEMYRNEFWTVDFVQAESLDWDIQKHYDLIMVDTNHQYDQTVKEYEKYKPWCKYMMFHDILWIDVKKFWGEIKQNHQHWEFVQQPPHRTDSMGIGLIKI